MANWTALSFPFSSYLTSLKLDQLVENLTAWTEGTSGSPAIQSAAVQSGGISLNKFKVAQASIASTGVISAVDAGSNTAYFTFNKYAMFPFLMVFSSNGGTDFSGCWMTPNSAGAVVGSADVPEFGFRRSIGTATMSNLIRYHYIDAGSF